jgi:hypothetical protein
VRGRQGERQALPIVPPQAKAPAHATLRTAARNCLVGVALWQPGLTVRTSRPLVHGDRRDQAAAREPACLARRSIDGSTPGLVSHAPGGPVAGHFRANTAQKDPQARLAQRHPLQVDHSAKPPDPGDQRASVNQADELNRLGLASRRDDLFRLVLIFAGPVLVACRAWLAPEEQGLHDALVRVKPDVGT